MNQQTRQGHALYITFTLFAVIILVSACAPPARPVASHMLNVVEAAGLRETVEIEIAATDPDRGRHATITDQAAIEEIIASLDTDLPLGRLTKCIEDYRLLFHLRDGTTQEFRYSAGEWGCLLLRGEQELWQGGETVPPETFNQLIAEQLAASSTSTDPKKRAMEIAVENARTLLDGPFAAHLEGVAARDAFLAVSLFRAEEGLPYPGTLFFDEGYPDYYVVVLAQGEKISAVATVTTEGEFWSLAPVGGEFSEDAEQYPHVSEQEAMGMAQAYAREQGLRVRGPLLAFAGGPFGGEFLPVWWFVLEGEETLMAVFVDQQGRLLTGMPREHLGWFMFKPHMTAEEAVEAAGYWLALTHCFYPSPILEKALASEDGQAEWVESQGENVDHYRITFGEYVAEVDDVPSDGLFAVRRR